LPFQDCCEEEMNQKGIKMAASICLRPSWKPPKVNGTAS
jgi:hypothetical protein